MNTKNIELLKSLLAALKLAPRGTHLQSSWIRFYVEGEEYLDYDEVERPPNMCHTSMCAAGHAAVLAGAEVPKWEHYENHGWALDKDGKLSNEYDPHVGVKSVSLWASEKLGLNSDEHDYIFFCFNEELALDRIENVISLWEQGKQFSYSDEYTN